MAAVECVELTLVALQPKVRRTGSRVAIRGGRAHASSETGLGIDWDRKASEKLQSAKPVVLR